MGIKLADSNICIFIDNGIILHSKAIENHISIHNNETEPCLIIGYVYGMLEEERTDEILDALKVNSPDEAIRILNATGIIDCRDLYYREFGNDLQKWPAPYFVCWTCNISARRDMILESGLFDERFTSWGIEDIDFGIMQYKNNVKFVLARDASSIHFPHGKTYTSDSAKLLEKVAYLNRIDYLYKKHPIRAMELWAATKSDNPLYYVNKILLEEDGLCLHPTSVM